jgi:hypothetical protein
MPVDAPMIGRAISSGLNLPFFPPTITRLAGGVDPSAELLSMGRPKLNGVSFPVELISRSAEILPFDVDTRCFRHQLLLGRQRHSPGSYADGRDRVEQRE